MYILKTELNYYNIIADMKLVMLYTRDAPSIDTGLKIYA